MSSWLNKTLVNKKRWKRRWCVLKGNIFYYHSDQAEKNLKGTIVLQGLLSINQIQKPTLFRKRSLVFSITDSNRTVYFQADTEQEWSSWCTILRTFDPRHSMPEPTTRYGLLGPTPSKLNQSNDTSYGVMPSHIENTEATRRNASVTSYGALPPIPPQKKTSATNAYGSLPNATPALEEGTTRSGGIDPGYGTLPILNEQDLKHSPTTQSSNPHYGALPLSNQNVQTSSPQYGNLPVYNNPASPPPSTRPATQGSSNPKSETYSMMPIRQPLHKTTSD